MVWSGSSRSPLPSVRGSSGHSQGDWGITHMGTCVCSQERAEGSQTLTARPSGRDSITHYNDLRHIVTCSKVQPPRAEVDYPGYRLIIRDEQCRRDFWK